MVSRMPAALASIAALIKRNHDSDSVPVKEKSVLRSSRREKSVEDEEKFHKLAAAYVNTGGSSTWDDTHRKGTVI